jgi:hypothetical protein
MLAVFSELISGSVNGIPDLNSAPSTSMYLLRDVGYPCDALHQQVTAI